MVARGTRGRSNSPNLSVRVELDNKALKSKNNTLTQTVAKLQQENAELLKQLTCLQGEIFDVSSKYNNLKNVISVIDSTTKMCLPKLNEVIETFTGILQLCNVAANITNYHQGTPPKVLRTHAVKPQIVNGHVLQNPTITLSRLSNDNNSNTPPPNTVLTRDTARPSTSNVSNDNSDVNNGVMRTNDGNDSDESQSENEELESSFVVQARRCSRRKPSGNLDEPDNVAEVGDFANENEEDEEPPVEEEEDSDIDQRLTTIHEMEEEEEVFNSGSPRSRQHRLLQGRLQEVRIYLNQLPNAYVEQHQGTGNISISLSPSERRSSYNNRSSSLVGEVNDSVLENGRTYLEEQLNSSRLPHDISALNESSRLNGNNTRLSVSFGRAVAARSPEQFRGASNGSNELSEQYSESTLRSMRAPSSSKSTLIQNEMDSLQSDNTIQELDMLHIQLQHKTSTPIASYSSSEGSDRFDSSLASPNRSKSDSSLMFKRNITKRRTVSQEKRKIAQVILNRLSLESRLTKSPIKPIENIVNMPPITKASNLTSRAKNGEKQGKDGSNSNSDEENVEGKGTGTGKASVKRRKKDSPTRKVGDTLKPKTKSSPPKKVGRPSRAAKPKSLKEPNLHKKMRRSK